MAGNKGVIETENRTFYTGEEIAKMLTPEYIRGLFEGEGTFSNDRRGNGERIPCVTLKMHYRDKELIEGIRDYFELRNKVYEYTHGGRHYAMLIIRDIPTLKNTVVPFFKNQLLGHKGVQFEAWLRMFPYLNSLHHRNLPRKQPYQNAMDAPGLEPGTSAMPAPLQMRVPGFEPGTFRM